MKRFLRILPPTDILFLINLTVYLELVFNGVIPNIYLVIVLGIVTATSYFIDFDRYFTQRETSFARDVRETILFFFKK